MTAHPEGNPKTLRQINVNKHNPLLQSVPEALDNYEYLPEPHFNPFQIHILGDLLDFLFQGNIFPASATKHLADPDLAIDIISGTDPEQDAESFIQLIERKINFALGDAPANSGDLANYTFRNKALFSSLLRGPAAEWYENYITNATTWDSVRANFFNRFSDGRNKFRYHLEVEHRVIGDGERMRNFLHRTKRTVDKGWPDDMNGIPDAHQAAGRDAQARKRRQRHIE